MSRTSWTSDGRIVHGLGVPIGIVSGILLVLGSSLCLIEKMLDISVRGSISGLAHRDHGRCCARLTGEMHGAILLDATCPEDQIRMHVEISVGADRDPTPFGLQRIEDSDLGHLAAGVLLLLLHHAEGRDRVSTPRGQTTRFDRAGERSRWLLHCSFAPETEHVSTP